MDRIENELFNRLQHTFTLYIRSAINSALTDNPSDIEVLQTIINMQAALELIGKMFVLRKKGWKGIISNKFHNQSESEILKKIQNGSIKTQQYGHSKDLFSRDIYLNDDDKHLLDSFQMLRNQVMHLGMVSFPQDLLNESIWFFVRIINQLDWQNSLPINDQYFTNTTSLLLGDDLYKKLINSSCYVDETIDRAYEQYEDDVRNCFMCGNESWILDEYEYLSCLVCGFKANEEAFGFVDCPRCNRSQTVAYDYYNLPINETLTGMCCACREFVDVSTCDSCGEAKASSASCCIE